MTTIRTNHEAVAQAKALLEQLGDVRIKYKGLTMSRSFALEGVQLQPYDIVSTAFGLQSYSNNEEFRFDPAAFDIAIVLLRYLKTFVAGHNYPHAIGDQPASDPVQAQEEEEHPLLRIAWADLDGSDLQSEMAKSRHLQSAIRYLIFRQMQLKDATKARFSFLDVMENTDMWERLWSKPSYALLHHIVWVKEDGKWDSRELKPRWRLGQQGKLEWDCVGDLGDLVKNQFGFHEGSDLVTAKQTGEATVLRVHMKPSEGHRKTWEQMREFKCPQFVLQHAGTHLEQQWNHVSMTLVATVHMPRQGTERIRLYSTSFEQVHLTYTMKKYSVEEGQAGVIRMGDPQEDEWMLYYVRAPDARQDGDYQESTAPASVRTDDRADVAILRHAAENPGADACAEPASNTRARAPPRNQGTPTARPSKRTKKN